MKTKKKAPGIILDISDLPADQRAIIACGLLHGKRVRIPQVAIRLVWPKG